MWELGEQVEAFCLAGDGFGGEPPSDAGQRDAVAGEALQIINMRRDAAEVGGAAQGDVDIAAPCVLDVYIRELREHFQHSLASGVRGVEGIQA